MLFSRTVAQSQWHYCQIRPVVPYSIVSRNHCWSAGNLEILLCLRLPCPRSTFHALGLVLALRTSILLLRLLTSALWLALVRRVTRDLHKRRQSIFWYSILSALTHVLINLLFACCLRLDVISIRAYETLFPVDNITIPRTGLHPWGSRTSPIMALSRSPLFMEIALSTQALA